MRMKKYQDLILAFAACLLGVCLAAAVVCAGVHIALGNPELTKTCALVLGLGGLGVLVAAALLVILGIWIRGMRRGRR